MSAWPPWKASGKLSAEAPRHLYHITWVINALSKPQRIPLGLSNAPVCSEVPSHYGSEFPVESLQYVWVCACSVVWVWGFVYLYMCMCVGVCACQSTSETLWLGGIVNLHLPLVTDWAPFGNITLLSSLSSLSEAPPADSHLHSAAAPTHTHTHKGRGIWEPNAPPICPFP